MKRYLAPSVIILLFLPVWLSAQPTGDCKFDGPMFYRVEKSAQYNGSLSDFFNREVTGKHPDVSGSVELQIRIDTSGRAWCVSIDKNAPVQLLQVCFHGR